MPDPASLVTAGSLLDALEACLRTAVASTAAACAKDGKLDNARLDQRQWASYELALAAADLLAARTLVDESARGTALDTALAACRDAKVTGAGFHVATASAAASATANGNRRYFRSSEAGFSMTARSASGTGSGYYAGDHFDLARLDTKQIVRWTPRRVASAHATRFTSSSPVQAIRMSARSPSARRSTSMFVALPGTNPTSSAANRSATSGWWSTTKILWSAASPRASA